MGSEWFTGGVVAASHGRIQFDFIFNGIRYRPSIKRPPSEANLRRARERLEAIKHQFHLDTFSFEEEFPDYRFLRRLGGVQDTIGRGDLRWFGLIPVDARDSGFVDTDESVREISSPSGHPARGTGSGSAGFSCATWLPRLNSSARNLGCLFLHHS
jgi:hypothetical protein